MIGEPEYYDVVWSGMLDKEGRTFALLPDRLTKPSNFWSPPKRAYNKKSDYWTTRTKVVDKRTELIDNLTEIEEL